MKHVLTIMAILVVLVGPSYAQHRHGYGGGHHGHYHGYPSYGPGYYYGPYRPYYPSYPVVVAPPVVIAPGVPSCVGLNVVGNCVGLWVGPIYPPYEPE